MNANEGYQLLAGKCRTICEAIVAAHPEFTLVRGHYFCPLWNRDRGHWWLVHTETGIIYDPTRDQFPSRGSGIYTPFDGWCECAQCGKKVKEEEAVLDSNYAWCSNECAMRFVGL